MSPEQFVILTYTSLKHLRQSKGFTKMVKMKLIVPHSQGKQGIELTTVTV